MWATENLHDWCSVPWKLSPGQTPFSLLTHIHLRHRLISKPELKATRNRRHQLCLWFSNFSLSPFLFLSTRTLYSIKISHEIPLYEIKMALFWLCQVGAQDPALWPRGSPASLVAPEEHTEKPQNAGQLIWKTKHLVPLLVSYMRKPVQRGYMISPELPYWPVGEPGRGLRFLTIQFNMVLPLFHDTFFGGTSLFLVTSL